MPNTNRIHGTAIYLPCRSTIHVGHYLVFCDDKMSETFFAIFPILNDEQRVATGLGLLRTGHVSIPVP